ncbi:MAG TPA: sulfite exporter TauE/SafE family protein [Pyrinomonadaceae bacterium]|nr:sulfite exporter TauE/SafE family protein [Pyrinomonadaceae bacterium]
MSDLWFYILAGFVAQIVDGALGMAYGLTASSFLISFGIAPASASATVHAAEVFTTGFSGLSHHYYGNVDKKLFWRLLIPGVIGAAVGAYVLASLPGEQFSPFVSAYLLIIGVVIIVKAFREFPPVAVTRYVAPLGFFGAMIDALGGGGWGPVVASTLLARGSHVRMTVGTVNAVEFFVTLTASIVFFLTLGLSNWNIILGLAIGGILAAPIGAYAVKRVPLRPLMFFVGLLIIFLSARTLLKALG